MQKNSHKPTQTHTDKQMKITREHRVSEKCKQKRKRVNKNKHKQTPLILCGPHTEVECHQYQYNYHHKHTTTTTKLSSIFTLQAKKSQFPFFLNETKKKYELNP